MKILARTESKGAIVEIDSTEYDAFVMAMSAINGDYEEPSDEVVSRRRVSMIRAFHILELVARGQMAVNLLKANTQTLEYQLLKMKADKK